MAIEIANGRFLTGAMYAPFCRTKAAPMEEWDNDMKNMAEAGFNCVHGFAEWHDIEYKKGEFDFTQIDHMVECAHRHGITAIINIATQNSVGFYSPRWLMEEYRGTGRGFIDNTGYSLMQSEYVVPCIDDPRYQAYASRYLAEVAKRFANDSRVGGFVLWGEPVLNQPGNFNSCICYCEHTVAKFRKWLKERYKNIEKLNETWCDEGPSDYVDFCQVNPPTHYSRQQGGFASWEDWREFMEYNLAGHIKNADRIFKENGATQPTICEMLTGISNSIDSWKLAETTDIIGTSCFLRPDRMTALYMNMADSMAKAFGKTTFVVEAAGGSVKFMNPTSPSANELKSTLLQRAGYGSKGLMYWCWRPRMSDTEGNDFGLVKPNGKVLPKTSETGKLAKKLDSVCDIYNKSERHSDVAIFMSQQINHLTDAENMTANYIDALTGANHMIADLHINSDFICEKEILKGSLGKYKALVLPCSYIISEECAEKIREFVNGGGLVIADFILAEKKPGGVCYFEIPGAGFDKVFGIERDDILYIEHPTQFKENTAGIRLGSIMEIITPTTAEILESYGEYPVITLNHFGDGSAVYVAGQFFASYKREPDVQLREQLLKQLKAVGIMPNLQLKNADKENQSQLITTSRSDTEKKRLSVVTITNSGYEQKCDTVVLPIGDYHLSDENIEHTIRTEGDKCLIDIKLGSWESVAVYSE